MDTKKLFSNIKRYQKLLEDFVSNGIEQNRKGWFLFEFVDSDGKPMKNVNYTLKQTEIDYKFGCNLFKYGCFENAEHNALYEEKFTGLFNQAVIPLYWSSLEPIEGKPRYEADSSFIDRRPPIEPMLKFCKAHNISVKGHPLYWGSIVPDWLPESETEVKIKYLNRLKSIAERYDGVIPLFDGVNECTTLHLSDDEPLEKDGYRVNNPMSGEFYTFALKRAREFFRYSKIAVNETSQAFWNYNKEMSPFYLFLENLILKGVEFDEIGLQYHLFVGENYVENCCEKDLNPSHLIKVLDTYAKFGKPISISEITLFGYDEEVQADMLEMLYSLWFAHRSTNAIVYWNLGDNCTATSSMGANWAEDVYKGGLLRSDFSEKPSYERFKGLLRKWRTDLEGKTETGEALEKVFYGKYLLGYDYNGKHYEKELHLCKDGFDKRIIRTQIKV